MTMINKKTITINTIILNDPSVQHTLNKLVINFFIIQINYAQNDACDDLELLFVGADEQQ